MVVGIGSRLYGDDAKKISTNKYSILSSSMKSKKLRAENVY